MNDATKADEVPAEQNVDWEGLRLFLAVAKAGSLAGAADKTGMSAPTLGRQMAALERSLGRKLFVRHQRGYELAVDGHALLAHVEAMDELAGEISSWSSGAYQLPNVTISAGTWVSRFLARNLSALWTPEDAFRLCFSTAEARLSLEHREADIGLRNARPQTGNVAAKRAVEVAFAPYCHRDFDANRHCNWVSVGREAGTTPSSMWVHSQPELWITTWVSSPQMLYEVVCGKGGQGVLPCFVGDSDPILKRSGEIIPELTHTMWIVAHDDERRQAEKRTVIDRLASLLRSQADLFAGVGHQTILPSED